MTGAERLQVVGSAAAADSAGGLSGTVAGRPRTVSIDLATTVQAAQHGDEEAFRLLYRSLQPGLLRYLTVMVGAEAEDVAAEAWLQVVRSLGTFQGGDGFRAWVVTIARNRALDHLRQVRRQPSLPLPPDVLDGLSSTVDTAAQADEAIDTDAAVSLIARLPPREAEAVLLRTVLGLDAESAGRVLGRRAGAVRTATHRGLRRLARLLQHVDTPAPGQPVDPDGSGTDPANEGADGARSPAVASADIAGTGRTGDSRSTPAVAVPPGSTC